MTIQCFCHAQSDMCVHKGFSLKNDIIRLTAATNETCIGRLYENHYLMSKELENRQNSNPYLLWKKGEIQLRLIRYTCFTCFTSSLLQIKPSIIRTINLKFENVPFTKKIIDNTC